MDHQPQPHKGRRKNSQPVRSKAGSSLQLPEDSGTQPSTFATRATVPEIATTRVVSATPSATPMNVAETERIMKEFLANLKHEENASEAFAKMAETLRLQEEATRLTTLHIPPRPSTMRETTTDQDITSTTRAPTTETLPEAASDEDAPSISPTVANPPHADEVEYTVEEVMEAAKRVEEGSKAGTSLEEDIAAEEVARDETEIVEEDDVTAGKISDTIAEEEVDITVDAEGETPVTDDEGETSEKIAEGETPVTDDEGEPRRKLWRGKPLLLLRSPTAVGSKLLLIL